MVSEASVAIVQKVLAILIILAFTGIHYLGHRIGSLAQNILTSIKVLLIAGLGVAGMTAGTGDWLNISWASGHDSTQAWGTAILLVMFAYSGWNASSYIAGEIKHPRLSIPISLVVGTGIVMVLYVAINLFIFRSTAYADLQGTITVVEVAARGAFGHWVGTAVSVIISVSLLSSVSAFIMIGPNVYAAMAARGHFFVWAAATLPQSGAPGRSLFIQGILASVMVLSGTFEQLLIYLGYGLIVFPAFAVLGLFIARHRNIGGTSAVKAWGYPITPLFFLAATVGLMVVAFMNRPLESTCAIATIALGIPAYWMFVHKRYRPGSNRDYSM
jgi:APA family basic amino acid/polyamine antiporter